MCSKGYLAVSKNRLKKLIAYLEWDDPYIRNSQIMLIPIKKERENEWNVIIPKAKP